jgi:hypothetical protein
MGQGKIHLPPCDEDKVLMKTASDELREEVAAARGCRRKDLDLLHDNDDDSLINRIRCLNDGIVHTGDRSLPGGAWCRSGGGD